MKRVLEITNKRSGVLISLPLGSSQEEMTFSEFQKMVEELNAFAYAIEHYGLVPGEIVYEYKLKSGN